MHPLLLVEAKTHVLGGGSEVVLDEICDILTTATSTSTNTSLRHVTRPAPIHPVDEAHTRT